MVYCLCVLSSLLYARQVKDGFPHLYTQSSSTQVIYVDRNATGLHNGSSWTTAFTTIQEAIDTVYTLGGGEVWVAKGKYSENRQDSTGAVVLKENVAIYGGFVGNETNRDQRSWSIYTTIIDGSYSRNSAKAYHVVKGANDSILDGFTITGGYANSTYPEERGGGLLVNAGTMQINNCKFSINSSSGYGGALCTITTSPTSFQINNCIFTDNASVRGAGIYFAFSTAIISDSTFERNTVLSNGGDPRPGGGLYNFASIVTVKNSAFLNNASPWGAGIYDNSSTAATTMIINCIFIGNYGMTPASGLHSSGAGYCNVINNTTRILNCTFVNNTAQYSGAIDNLGSIIITNNIIWNNKGTISNKQITGGGVTIKCCDIEGGFSQVDGTATDAGGNLNLLPNFTNSSFYKGPDGIIRTSDDGLTLASNSPCINTGTIQDAPDSDILGVLRPQGGGIDMGAYESLANDTMVIYASGFEDPQELAFDTANYLYVGHSRNASGLSIYRISPGGGSYIEFGSNAFSDPDGLDIDSSGNIWVSSGTWANTQDGEVKEVTPAGNVSDVGSNYLNNPTSLEIDRIGRFGEPGGLLVGNQNMAGVQIIYVDTTGNTTVIFDTTAFFVILDICLDPMGTVWFIGGDDVVPYSLYKWPVNDSVQKVQLAGVTGPISGLAYDSVQQTLVVGASSERRIFRVYLDGTVGEEIARGLDPRSITIHRSGDIYVSDTVADVVWRIGRTSKIKKVLFSDIDKSDSVSMGDKLTLQFNNRMRVNNATVSDFYLPVSGDGLEIDATIAINTVNDTQVIVTLGASPQLTILGQFVGSTTAGSPSGIDVSASMVPNAIEDLTGLDAIDGGMPGVNDSGVDILYTVSANSAFVTSYSEGTIQVNSDRTNAYYTEHKLIVPAGALTVGTTITIGSPGENHGRLSAVSFEPSTLTFSTAEPATLILEYKDSDCQREQGYMETAMRIHQWKDSTTGWVLVPDTYGKQSVDLVNKSVSVKIDRFNMVGVSGSSFKTLGETLYAPHTTVVYANIALPTVGATTNTVAPAPSGFRKSDLFSLGTTVTLSVTTAGIYTKHQLTLTDYTTAYSGVTVMLDQATLSEMHAHPNYAVMKIVIYGEITTQATLTMEYKDQNDTTNQFKNDVIDGIERQMRIYRYRSDLCGWEKVPEPQIPNTVANIVTATLDNINFAQIYAVKVDPSISTTNNPPTAVKLIRPSNGISTTNLKPTFIWSTAFDLEDDTIMYQLQVDNNVTFTSPEFQSSFSFNTQTTSISNLANGLYYWRVISQDTPLLAQNTSAVWTFSIDTQAPTAGTIIINNNAGYTINTSVTVSWSGAVDVLGIASIGLSNTTSGSYTWSTYSAGSCGWILSTGDGTKTVYAVFKDYAGNVSSQTADTIILDMTPPTVGTVSINTNAVYTQSTVVNVKWSSATDNYGVASVGLSNTSGSGYVWSGYTSGSGRSWNLISGEGTKTVYVVFRDNAGNISVEITDTIILDATAPTNGTISINTAASYTRSTSVYVTWSNATDTYGVASVGISNTSGSGYMWSGYPAGSGRSWNLISGEGTKTVYAVFRDNAGNISVEITGTIILDATAPTNGTISINTAATYTRSTSVYVTWSSASDTYGVASVGISNTSGSGYVWSGYTAGSGRSWNLTSGDGTKTVYAVFRDNAGNQSVQTTDTIILDMTAPTGGSISINTGAQYTASTIVQVIWSGVTDTYGVVSTGLSNSSSGSYFWYPYSQGTVSSWILPAGDGTKTVYAVFMDNARNISSQKSDSIILDMTTPSGSIVINSNAGYTKSTTVTLTLSATDAGSGVTTMRFANNTTSWSSWENYNTTKSWTLASGEGIKSVYVQFEDKIGNQSISYSDTIILDMTKPSSNVGTIFPYYQTSVPFNIPYFATDTLSGLSQVQLYYASQALTGGSWSSYTVFSTITVTGLVVSGNVAFTAPKGAKKYVFYTLANDIAGNWESSPGVADATMIYNPDLNTKLFPDIKLLKNQRQSQLFDLDTYTTAGYWQVLYTGNLGNVSINSTTNMVDYLTPLSASYGEDTISYVADGLIGYPSVLKYSSHLLKRLPDALIDNGKKISNCDINLQSYISKETTTGYPTSYPTQVRYSNSLDSGKLTISFSGSTIRISPSSTSTLSAPAEVIVTASPGISGDWDKEIVHIYEIANSYGQFTVSSDTSKWYFEKYGDSTAAGSLSWVSNNEGMLRIAQKPGEKGKLSQIFTVSSSGWYTAQAKVATEISDTTKQQKVYLYLYEYTKDTVIKSGANQVIASGSGAFGGYGKWKNMLISYYATGTILGIQVVGINPTTSKITGNIYFDDVWVYPAPPQVERCYGATPVSLINQSFDTNTTGWLVELYGDGTGIGTWSWVSSWSGRSGIIKGTQSGGQKAKVSQLYNSPSATKNAMASVWVYSGATTQSNTQKVYLYLYSYDSGYKKILESGNGILYTGQWTPGQWRELKFGYTPMSAYNAVQVVAINITGKPTQSIYFDSVAVDQDQDSDYYWDNTLF
jgi:uncharacterized protein YdeI (BOF family)